MNGAFGLIMIVTKQIHLARVSNPGKKMLDKMTITGLVIAGQLSNYCFSPSFQLTTRRSQNPIAPEQLLMSVSLNNDKLY